MKSKALSLATATGFLLSIMVAGEAVATPAIMVIDPDRVATRARASTEEPVRRGVRRTTTVTLPRDFLRAPEGHLDPARTMTVPLGDGRTASLVERDRIDASTDREDIAVTHVTGVVDVDGFSRFFAVLEDGELDRLEIRIGAEVVRLTARSRDSESTVFNLVAVDSSQIPQEREPVPYSLPGSGRDDPPDEQAIPTAMRDEPDEGVPTGSEAPTVVRIAVFYTFAARLEAMGYPYFIDIEDAIEDAIAAANITFEDQVGMTLVLAHLQEVVYVEREIVDEDLARLTNPCEQLNDSSILYHLSEVFEPWKTSEADLVSLWIRGRGGVAHIMEDRTLQFATGAVSVVDWFAAINNYTMEHEIGHNLSARHDRKSDNTNDKPDAFNHGYHNMVSQTSGRATLMAYPSACDDGATCFRVPLWSDPEFPQAGDWGIAPPAANAAFNRQSLQMSLPYAADFQSVHDQWLGCCVNVGSSANPDWQPGACP